MAGAVADHTPVTWMTQIQNYAALCTAIVELAGLAFLIV